MNVSSAIETRITTKMLADPENPLPHERDLQSELSSLIATSGHAPFHRPAHTSHRTGNEASILEPWRIYALDTTACRNLLSILKDWPEPAGKILNMLAAADALLQVTWLPDPGTAPGDTEFHASLDNMEHIAATAAVIQNLLVAANAADLKTYWSSGGVLRSRALFNKLGIPESQILLGSIFFFPTTLSRDVNVLPGKQRSARSSSKSWSRWLEMT